MKRLLFFYANPRAALHFTGPTVIKIHEEAILSITTADGQAAAPIVVLRPRAAAHTCLELARLELATALKIAKRQSQDPDNVIKHQDKNECHIHITHPELQQPNKKAEVNI
jgi:hypothetical protein